MSVRARYALIVLVCTLSPLAAAQLPRGAAIASAHPLATQAGERIFRQGGNAFDAAVAVAAALAVVEPYSSGLGGGAFFLLHRAADRLDVMVDGRETAPSAAKPEQYLDPSGAPREGATTRGGTSVAIPGQPAALAHVAQRYGRLPLSATLAPAIELARDGFPVDARYARVAKLRERYLQSMPRAAAQFLHQGAAPAVGQMLSQPALAATLEQLGREGASAFYTGRIADALVSAVNAAGGTWGLHDLSAYRIVERQPIRIRYRGATLVSAPLPSAGGIALAQALGMLERHDVGNPLEPRTAHLVAEALRRAFQDRASFLGDSDHAAVPVARLLDPAYLATRASTIDVRHASVSAELEPGAGAKAESGNTTHLSVVDPAGNRVAATLSINWIFGSGLVAGDTGVLLNNEMDDFTVRSDVSNSYRLRGGTANAIAPGKRPLSSMTPTFLEDERGVLVLGAPGGSRIVSQVLVAVLKHLDARTVDVRALVAAPRYHHQYWPDRLEIEPEGFPAPWRAALAGYGHKLETASRRWGNMQIVFQSRDRQHAQAASDPRGSDIAWY